jgi:hypothetical protein
MYLKITFSRKAKLKRLLILLEQKLPQPNKLRTQGLNIIILKTIFLFFQDTLLLHAVLDLVFRKLKKKNIRKVNTAFWKQVMFPSSGRRVRKAHTPTYTAHVWGLLEKTVNYSNITPTINTPKQACRLLRSCSLRMFSVNNHN